MARSIEEATAGLIEAIEETDTGELLALIALLIEASNQATETREREGTGQRERVFAAMGPLIGVVLTERHSEEMTS